MAATIKELIKKGFSMHNEGISAVFKSKIEIFSSHFGSIDSFLRAKREDFEKLIFVIDNPHIKLTDKDYEKIKAFQTNGYLDPKLSIQQNFVKILTTDFINKQLLMIENLDLKTLNVNPILAGALNLNNETDLIRYYVYQAISRSVVTSVGFFVQKLIIYSNEYVYDGKDEELGEQTKWDAVVEKFAEVKAYLEIKSEQIIRFLTEKEVLEILTEKEVHLFCHTAIYDLFFFNTTRLTKLTDLINCMLDRLRIKIDLKIT
ncbi:MAG: hypothetical protein MUE85_04675 [Microscillaceae bacterium]|jgi:hypothetical protein|nr:hypothetical protein [Microscillaceae bacterium]